MSDLVEVAGISELANGTMTEVLVEGHEILLARVGDKYYAAHNRCPHMAGKLSKGKLEGTVVTCPVHGSQFDLADGRVVRWLKGTGLISIIGKAVKGPKPLVLYKVKAEDNRILVEI
jgi:3-phenylpropionate/trans-cinnamate dioxygenase ferredoxin component